MQRKKGSSKQGISLLTLEQWFPNRGDFASAVEATSGDIFGGHNLRDLVGRGQGCCETSNNAQGGPPEQTSPAQNDNNWEILS